jgi:hypothetical protein
MDYLCAKIDPPYVTTTKHGKVYTNVFVSNKILGFLKKKTNK